MNREESEMIIQGFHVFGMTTETIQHRQLHKHARHVRLSADRMPYLFTTDS